MRHDWIFDVLADLRAYAHDNDLPALAAQVTAALRVAEVEITDEGQALARLRSSSKEEREKATSRAH